MTRALLTVVAALAVLSVSADLGAQPAGKVSRVGFLHPGAPPNPNAEIFAQSLRDLGYVEGRTVAIDYRWAEGQPERFARLAGELVALKVDVVVVGTTAAVKAVADATKTIPIVNLKTAKALGLTIPDSLRLRADRLVE
jgi:putative tryptophan/tyrosine transport system substrate-binding protein